ncbi:hypothetical protein Tco_1491139 [Tanacetum coccineum]
MNEQSHYKQDKTKTRQSINVKRHIFNVISGTEEFKERDLNIRGIMEKNPHDPELKKKEAECLENYMEAVIDAEFFLYQRAKIEWLKSGDINSKFFHKVIKSRRHGNRVTSICNKEGTKFERDMVVEQFVKHFHNFLGTVDNVTPIVDANDLFKNELNDNEATNMICDVTNAEIKNVVFDIDDVKALGPDELLNGYNCKNGPKRCALKVDIAKAYDTLSWEFIESILKQFGFHNKMIQWVFPLMVARKVAFYPTFINHIGCKELKLTHLSFADDLLVMSHGDHTFISIIKDDLNEFSDSSGHKPNMSKSTIFFGSVDAGENREFWRNKVNDWKYKTLSYAGRLYLISSVLSVMQIYRAFVMMLPKTNVKEINKLMKSFLWSHGKRSKGKAKIAWSVACCPKNEGGIGLKLLDKWNEVLLIKHI